MTRCAGNIYTGEVFAGERVQRFVPADSPRGKILEQLSKAVGASTPTRVGVLGRSLVGAILLTRVGAIGLTLLVSHA